MSVMMHSSFFVSRRKEKDKTEIFHNKKERLKEPL